jgi:hypothetical protein
MLLDPHYVTALMLESWTSYGLIVTQTSKSLAIVVRILE